MRTRSTGVLGCFDRMIITGTLPTLCYADGMTRYLSARGLRIFDFVKFVQPLTEAIKANAEALAAEAGLKVDYIRKKNFRKQDKVKAVIEQRGDQARAGVGVLGARALHDLSAVARQAERPYLSAIQRREVSALLLLFHR